MHRAALFLVFVCSASMLLVLLLYLGVEQAAADNDLISRKRELVSQLGLTDLSIWSEARYTRHPSQADLFTAFQDSPGAFDHFPAGSIVGPGNPQRSTSLRILKKGQP